MNRRALFLSMFLFGVGLVLADNLLDWGLWWKVALAGGLALVPIFLMRRTTATPTTPATTGGAAPRDTFGDYVIPAIVSLAMGALVVYGVIFWVIVPIWNFGNQAAREPTTRIVEIGFTRHDAKYPVQDVVVPFNKILTAGKTYQVFKLKQGDIFQVVQLSAPIKYKIDNPVVTGFAPIKKPIKIRVNYDGNLLVVSSTGNNTVMITRE